MPRTPCSSSTRIKSQRGRLEAAGREAHAALRDPTTRTAATSTALEIAQVNVGAGDDLDGLSAAPSQVEEGAAKAAAGVSSLRPITDFESAARRAARGFGRLASGCAC